MLVQSGFVEETDEVAMDLYEDMELDDDTASVKGAKKEKRKKKFVRTCAGQIWEDESLAEWNPGG